MSGAPGRLTDRRDLPVASDLQAARDAFVSWARAERRFAANTVAAYAADLDAWLAFLAGHLGRTPCLNDIASLSPAELRAWASRRLRDGISARSRAREQSVLRSFARFLDRSGRAHCPNLLLARRPKTVPGLPRPIAAAQADRLLALAAEADPGAPPWVAARDAALFTLLYAAGLRIGEALALDWQHLPGPDEGAVLTVDGKGGKQRRVPLLPVAATRLLALAAAQPFSAAAESPIFRGVRGGRLSPRLAQLAMASLRVRLGLPDSATPHALRHSFATELLAAGADLRSLQELLGHASPSTTQVYTEVGDSALFATYAAAHPRSRG